MNREILFKAKRIDNGEWVEGNLITNERNENQKYIGYIFDEQNGVIEDFDIVEVIPYTICQYTGLTDKNGKKIWENDILCAYLDDEYPENRTLKKVIWNTSGFYTKETYSTDIEPLDEWDSKHFEVIGNIFDNSELLEVE